MIVQLQEEFKDNMAFEVNQSLGYAYAKDIQRLQDQELHDA